MTCARIFATLLLLPPVVISQSAAPIAEDSLRLWVERFEADRDLLRRRYELPLSLDYLARMNTFYAQFAAAMAELDFDALPREAQIDYLLLRDVVRHHVRELARDTTKTSELRAELPFCDTILELATARRAVAPIDPAQIAARLDALAGEVRAGFERIVARDLPGAQLRRVADAAGSLRRCLDEWFEFYDGYDPQFGWWNDAPYRAVRTAFDEGEQRLRKLDALSDAQAIVGRPIGRDALLDELRLAMIPYSPAELIAIAQQEFAWCDARMLEASRELGFGDDWHAALEHVKQRHVAPGEQPAMIRELALEAIDWVESRDLVTVPPLCKESWRMTMLSPEAQRVSPFFLGGEAIQVAFPTDAMAHIDKLMSMRGNNRHFARATVHHELIPGHHLQGYTNARNRTYRRTFRTPFWIEGWALYWETLLWDKGFARSAEDRIGMLFWRMHRCARIVFSLSFHLGEMSEQQCIDFLVERVGHERANATAEVRRSFTGGYGPLYQAAYMLGALQLRALRRDLVDIEDGMPEKVFHDAVLHCNAIPIEMVRASLVDSVRLSPDYEPNWRFYGDVEVSSR